LGSLEPGIVAQPAFIEGWYNPRRRHPALDYLSPVDYEKRIKAEAHIPSP